MYEEANRTRAAIAAIARRLAARGIATALPDLPGQGDSLLPTAEATLAGWRSALARAAATLVGPVHLAAWRGGALLSGDVAAVSRWLLSPLDGTELARDLARWRSLGRDGLYAGNALSPGLVADLAAACVDVAPPSRTVRLSGDARPADAYLAGRPLWRAAEPDTDATLQAAVAEDLAAWIDRCAA